MHTTASSMMMQQGFRCRYCDKVYSTEANLIAHHQITHGDAMMSAGAGIQQITTGQMFPSNLYGVRPPLPSVTDTTLQPSAPSFHHPTMPLFTSSSQSLQTQDGTFSGMSLPITHTNEALRTNLKDTNACHDSGGIQQPINETRDLFHGIVPSAYNLFSAGNHGDSNAAQKTVNFHQLESNPLVTTNLTQSPTALFSNVHSLPSTATSVGQFYTTTVQGAAIITEIGPTNSTQSSINKQVPSSTLATLSTHKGLQTTSDEGDFSYLRHDTHPSISASNTTTSSQNIYSQGNFPYQRQFSALQDISTTVSPSNPSLLGPVISQAITEVTFSSYQSQTSTNFEPTHTGQPHTQSTAFARDTLDQSPQNHQQPGTEASFMYQQGSHEMQELTMNMHSSQRSSQASFYMYQAKSPNVAELSTTNIGHQSQSVGSHQPVLSNSSHPGDENSDVMPNQRLNEDPVSHKQQSGSPTASTVLTLPYQSTDTLPSVTTTLSSIATPEETLCQRTQDTQVNVVKGDSTNDSVKGVAGKDTESDVFMQGRLDQDEEGSMATTSLSHQNNLDNIISEQNSTIKDAQPQLINSASVDQSFVQQDESQKNTGDTDKGDIVNLERSMRQHWASVEEQIINPALKQNEYREEVTKVTEDVQEQSNLPHPVELNSTKKDEVLDHQPDPNDVVTAQDGDICHKEGSSADNDTTEQGNVGMSSKNGNASIGGEQNGIKADNSPSEVCVDTSRDESVSQKQVDKVQSHDDILSNNNEDRVSITKESKDTLTCPICDKEFKTHGGLKRHKTAKHKNSEEKPAIKKHKCAVCKNEFKTMTDLTKHERTHKGRERGHHQTRSKGVEKQQTKSDVQSESDGDSLCDQCNKSFKSLRALNMHKISHRASPKAMRQTRAMQARSATAEDDSEKDVFSCTDCDRTFKTKRGLACHEDKHKNSKREAKVDEKETKSETEIPKRTQTTCDTCEASFKSKKELSDHKKALHKVQSKKRSAKSRERCHKCSTCGKGFLERSHLKEHEKRHSEPDIPCPDCDKKFKFLTDLRKHQRSHSDHKPFICPTCGNTFKAASHLAEHELRHGEPKFACQHCGKRYHVEREMKKHEKIHTDKVYQCPHCEEEFREKTLLQEHVRNHEQKGTLVVKQYMCKHCNLYFSSEKGLLHHINNKHRQLIRAEDQWQFICDHCNRVCQTEETLKLHKKLHKGDRVFPCSKCDKFFKSAQHLREHEKRHGEANLSCKICNWKFVLAVDLRKHEKRHAMNKSLPCKHCDKKFSTNGALNAHIKRHTQTTSSFVCAHCKLGFRSGLGLKYHQNQKHLEKLSPSARWKHPCDHCNMVFPTLSAMQRHKNMQGKYTCQICNLVFRTEKAFKLHQQIHLGLRNHCCPVCSKGFKKAHHLAEHMKRHSEGKHPCKVCGKKYVFPTDLRKHMKLSHLSSKLIPCTQCEKKFQSERMLRQHIMLHHQIPVEKQHVCYDCNLQFSGAKGLLSHMNNKHRDKLAERDRWKFPCEKCQRMFRSSKALEVHYQAHSNVRPHECDQCGKRFKEARHLVEHTKRHGEGHHPCPKCDKKYVFERDLVKHMKTHSEVKEFVCPECGKAFIKNGDLNAHLMRHEQVKKDPTLVKVKPLQCPHCTLTFVHKKGLDTHLNNKHREELPEDDRWPFWCDRCKKAFRTKTAMKKHEPEHLGKRDFVCEVCKKSFKVCQIQIQILFTTECVAH